MINEIAWLDWGYTADLEMNEGIIAGQCSTVKFRDAFFW